MNHINCYPLIFRQRVVNYYNKRIQPIKNVLDMSNGSLYNWISKKEKQPITR